VVVGVGVVAGCVGGCGSSGQGGATVVTLPTGDRFNVVLPGKWTVDRSNGDGAFLFGGGAGSVFIDETDCESAQACQAKWVKAVGGETLEETVGGVTYYEHRHYMNGGGDQEHWYVDWNGHVYDVNLSLVGRAAQDPEPVRSVVRSIEWLE